MPPNFNSLAQHNQRILRRMKAQVAKLRASIASEPSTQPLRVSGLRGFGVSARLGDMFCDCLGATDSEQESQRGLSTVQ